MTDVDLLDRLAKTDAYADSNPLPDGWSSQGHLGELVRRATPVTDAVTGRAWQNGLSPRPRPLSLVPDRRTRLGLTAIAALVTIAVLASVALVGGGSGVMSDGRDGTIDSVEALATADRIFAALHRADPDGVIAEFTPDAKIEARAGFNGSGESPTSRSGTRTWSRSWRLEQSGLRQSAPSSTPVMGRP